MNHRNISAIAFVLIAALTICSFTTNSKAQALSAGTITGIVVDPNGAVVPNATVFASAITRGDRASKQSNPVANGARSMKVSSGIGEVRCAGQPLILSTG